MEIQKHPLDPKAFDKVLKAADTSGEGSVDSGEIAVVLKKVHDADKNGDGKLDKAESKALAKSLGDKSLAKSFEGADVEALSNQINFPGRLQNIKPMPPIICPPWPYKGGLGEIDGHLKELGKAIESGKHPHIGIDQLPPPDGGMTTIELTADQLKALTELLKKLTLDGGKPTPCIGLDPRFGGGTPYFPPDFDPVQHGAEIEQPQPKPLSGKGVAHAEPTFPPDFDPIRHGMEIEQPMPKLPLELHHRICKLPPQPMEPPICIGIDPRFRSGSLEKEATPIELTPADLEAIQKAMEAEHKKAPGGPKPTICIGLDPRFGFGKKY